MTRSRRLAKLHFHAVPIHQPERIAMLLEHRDACTPEDSAAAGAAPSPFELEEATIADLGEAMAAGRRTARSITEAYLARIEALDRQGPTLRHVLETNPDVFEIADALDAERRAGRIRGPMHGIPVLIKDNIDTADRMTTTAGSLALEGTFAPRDSHVAARLREAGAILLAKASLSEWANFRGDPSSSGWCSRGGQGRNPYVLDRSPCGSSSGTGGGIAAGYAAVGVGTETNGSIVCPASACGLVGIKPTVGLISRAGIIPISHSADTAGPMARTVRDAAVLLGAMAGPDPRDPVTASSRGRIEADYASFLDADGLRGARIGIAREGLFGYSHHADRIAEEAIGVLRQAGAEIVDPADIPKYADYEESGLEVLLYEFRAGLNAYLAARGPDTRVRSLADVIAFNEANRDRVMPYFGQELLERAEAKGPLTERAYLDALARCRRLSRDEGIDAVMDRHRLDALFAPTLNPIWPIDLANGDHFLGGASSPAAVAGYPHITVPGGDVHGLPVGVSFFGRAWSEPVLLRLAFAYEQATKHRRAPGFRATISSAA